MATKLEHLDELELSTIEPKRYRVILLNDDYSTMEFVIEILMTIFKKSQKEATDLMLMIHQKGSAICGVYGYEIAEMKVFSVKKRARENGFPLKAVMEEVSND